MVKAKIVNLDNIKKETKKKLIAAQTEKEKKIYMKFIEAVKKAHERAIGNSASSDNIMLADTWYLNWWCGNGAFHEKENNLKDVYLSLMELVYKNTIGDE